MKNKAYRQSNMLKITNTNEKIDIWRYILIVPYFRNLDGSNFLTIKRGDGTPSCIFTHAYRDYFGKWHLEGRFRLIDGGWRHFLVQQ